MTPALALPTILDATLKMLPRGFDSPEAELMLLAIAMQESRFIYRRQVNGPARSYWQFERGGGVRGVLKHHASRDLALKLCSDLDYKADEDVIYAAMEHNDILACGFARLLLYTDPKPLPKLGEREAAWDYYVRNWRPGKPHPETWPEMYMKAKAALG